ncbi:MAG: ESPR-type extended signal peptide-containing protein, partial [[Actinobacillus] rossii]|nr:ESPR-type extended signal peptide-containing protein [[Actinobacillus] rossii]MDY3123338.1 ESPR-type extended signal peptide-containing protein [[Actinobacillus] rossii]MDY5793490.1 ESPR-type extended signal peptide-containing protein [[Actinobacillus] rossii]
MNKIFKVIWNHTAQRFVVVSELTKSNGKSSSTTDNRIEPSKVLLAVSVAGAALLGSAQVMAATAALVTDSTGKNIKSGGSDLYIHTNSNDNSIAIGGAAGKTGGVVTQPAKAVVGGTAIGSTANAGEGSVAISFASNASGANSVSIGYTSSASGSAAIGIGLNVKSSALDTIAVGHGSNASGQQSVAVGSLASSSGTYSVAMGMQANAIGMNSTAIGQKATSNAPDAIVIGTSAGVYGKTGDSAISMGRTSFAAGERAVAIGRSATANGTRSTAIGPIALALGDYSVVMGSSAKATETATNSVAIGNATTVSGANSGAVGPANNVTGAGTFVFGSNITATADNNVILGQNSTENSTTTKMGASNQVTTATVGGLTYSGFQGKATGIVSVGATGAERQIINVAPGNISATSTDAINGSQLYATNNVLGNVYNSTTAALGGTVTPTDNAGNFTVSYDLTGNNPSTSESTGTTYNNVGAALTALSEAVNQPLTFKADVNSTTRELGSTLQIVAGNASNTSTRNVKTNVVEAGKLEISFSDTPSLTSITVDGNKTSPISIGADAAGNNYITNLTTTIPVLTTEVAAADKPTTNLTNAATLGDVLNAGWNLQENGLARDLVTPYNTVNFVNGTGTTVSITNTDGNLSTVKVDVNTSALTGNITQNTNGTVTVPAGEGNKFANTSTVAESINKSGWTAAVGKTGTGDYTDNGGDSLVNPGDTVKFIAGDNMNITKNGLNYTIATNKNVKFDTVAADKGLTIGSGDNAVNMTPTTTTVANGETKPAVNMNGATL